MNYSAGNETQSLVINHHCQDVFDIGYWKCDPVAETVHCGPVAREHLNIDQRDNLTLENWLSMIHPKDRTELADRINEVTTTETADLLDRTVRLSSQDKPDRLLRLRADTDENLLHGIVQDVTEQQAQKQQVECSEAIFEHTQAGLFVITVRPSAETEANESRFVFDQVNEEYEHSLGVAADNIEGKTPNEAFGDEDGKAISNRCNECLTEQAVIQYEQRFERDGNERILQTRLSPVVVDGEVKQLVGSTREVTQEKPQQRELQKVTEQFDLAIEGAELGVWTWNLTTDSFEYNEQLANLVGLDVDVTETDGTTALGRWESRVHSDDQDALSWLLSKELNGETDRYCGDHRLQTADNEWKWMRAIGKVVERTSTGEPKRIVGGVRDIDAEKRAEQTLHKEQAMFTQGPVVVCKWKNDAEAGWPVTYVSENVEEVFGYTPEELYAADPAYSEIIHDEDLPRVTEEVKSNDGSVDQFQHDPYRIKTATGEIRWVLDYTQNVRDEDGTITDRVGYIVDITERKDREIYLEQAEAVGEFGTGKWGIQTDENWWSDGMYTIFEQPHDAEPLTYEEILGFVHPEDRGWVKETWENADGDTYNAEFRIQVNGSVKWIEAQCVQNIDSTGGVAYSLGVFKNITERKQREQVQKTLTETGRKLLAAASADEITTEVAEVTVDAFDATASGVYLHDEDSGALVSKATAGAQQQLHTDRTFASSDTDVWNAYASQTQIQTARSQDTEAIHSDQTVDTKTENETTQDTGDEDHLIEYVYPLGTHGVLLLTYEKQCSEQLRNHTEILANITGTALDRTNRVAGLKHRTESLNREIETLEDQLELCDILQSLLTELTTADSAAEIRQITCRNLSTVDDFDGVWFGRPDPETNRIEPLVDTTMPTEYFDDTILELQGATLSPAARVTADRTIVNRGNIANDSSRSPWQNTALIHGFQSVLSIPVLYGDVLFGVLTVYSRDTNTFDERTTEILTEFGQFIGYALKTTEHQNTIYEDQTKQLVFEIDPTAIDSESLHALCRELSVAITIENVSQRYEQSHLVHARIENVDSEVVADTAASLSGIGEINPVTEKSTSRYEIVTIGESIPGDAIATGAELQSITLTTQSCEIVYTIPTDSDIQEFVNQIQDIFTGVDLKLTYETEPVEDEPRTNISPHVLNETLSEWEQTVLRTAYHSGYFDKNRKRTGGEIAASLDIAQPTFAKYLRKAEKNLFEAIWEQDRADSAQKQTRT